MGLFGFNAEKKLAKAQEHLARGDNYEARRGFEEILLRQGVPESLRSVAKDGWMRARRGMMEVQLRDAESYEQQGELESAAESLRTAIEIAEDDLDTGNARENLRKIERLIETGVKPGARARVAPVAVHPAASAVVETSGQEEPYLRDDPEQFFEVYLQTLHEEDAEAYRGLGDGFREAYLALQEGRAEEAMELFDELPPGVRHAPACRLERAQTLLLLRKNEEAYDELHGLEMPHTGRRVAEMRTVLLARMERNEEALTLAKGVWENAKDMDAAILYGEQLLVTGQYEETRALLKPFVDVSRPNAEVDTLLSRAYVGAGSLDDARELLERALEAHFQGVGAAGRDANAFPVWAAKELLPLYVKIGESSETIRQTIQHLILHDPEGAEEYRAFYAAHAEKSTDEGTPQR